MNIWQHSSVTGFEKYVWNGLDKSCYGLPETLITGCVYIANIPLETKWAKFTRQAQKRWMSCVEEDHLHTAGISWYCITTGRRRVWLQEIVEDRSQCIGSWWRHQLLKPALLYLTWHCSYKNKLCVLPSIALIVKVKFHWNEIIFRDIITLSAQ